MQGKLIALKEEVLRVMARGHVKEDVYDAVSRAFDRHESEQGEGLRERLDGYLFMLDKSGFDSDKEYAKEIRRTCLAPTTPDKAVEPLPTAISGLGVISCPHCFKPVLNDVEKEREGEVVLWDGEMVKDSGCLKTKAVIDIPKNILGKQGQLIFRPTKAEKGGE